MRENVSPTIGFEKNFHGNSISLADLSFKLYLSLNETLMQLFIFLFDKLRELKNSHAARVSFDQAMKVE
jgi:hypothetical protein